MELMLASIHVAPSSKPCVDGNGAVVVNMGSIPNATGSGTPANSYGFIRFKAKIN